MDEGGNGKAEEDADQAWYEHEVPEFVRNQFREGLARKMGTTAVRTCGGGGV